MQRFYYTSSIQEFLATHTDTILGKLATQSSFDIDQSQRDAWLEEITVLRSSLGHREGTLYFEYSIPRMGKRIDVVLLIGSVIFVIEFKTGARQLTSAAKDQVWDYGLDLKNFHETSAGQYIVPVLVSNQANAASGIAYRSSHKDKLLTPVLCNKEELRQVLTEALTNTDRLPIDATHWQSGRYCPTPTIIEAALALYKGHAVADISRSDASAINLSITSNTIAQVIRSSRANSRKTICFVTGVPGAGKTLVGLNVATTHIDKKDELHSVFLSGNGPLVDILREALARDQVLRAKEAGQKVRKAEATSQVKMFIQNVHHFRDDCLVEMTKPPIEHVAIFDEAQRAWNLEQTSSFMRRKKNRPNFAWSEPEFLISCMDRHPDWAVVICLVGGGQEIHTGEAGIGEWLESLRRSFPDWQIVISSRLTDSEYAADRTLQSAREQANVEFKDELHLSVSMRSFRAERVSSLVKQVLDLEVEQAQSTLRAVKEKFPIVITRDLTKAKQWLKTRARGSERYGIVVSSHAERLKPHAIDVKSPMDPIHWFLDSKEDVRSSYFLEDVATEFHVQGLELDWTCVTWDADFRRGVDGWEHWTFVGDRWNRIKKPERQAYQKNAYRVLLTRARQGMVIVVPAGDAEDLTRIPSYYDPTFEYLTTLGFEVI